MRGGTMEKRLRLGVFPNLPKEKVRALLPKLVEFCRVEIGRYVSVTVSGRMFPVERGLPVAVL